MLVATWSLLALLTAAPSHAAIQLPPGFTATLWSASGINGGDGLTFGPYTGPGGGTRLYVTHAHWGQGKITTFALGPNFTAGSQQLFAAGFDDQIVGCTYDPSSGYWYAGHGGKIAWMKDKNGDGDALDFGERGELLTGLTGGSSSRTKHSVGKVTIGPDGWLYFNVGSRSDHGEEPEPPNQAVMRRVQFLTPETPGTVENYATGLRNASGHTWMNDGRLVATEHGPDCDFPDELNVITQGADYGFPYCYGDGTEQPPGCPIQTGCAGTAKPVVNFPAHTAPIGIRQYNGTLFPLKYRGGLIVASFGNLVDLEDTSQGRNLTWVTPDSNDGSGHWIAEDFMWDTDSNPYTRQLSWLADVEVAPDGSLFVVEFSDQNLSPNSGSIYRITFRDYTPPTPVTVTDEGDITLSHTTLSATWTPSSDPESGIRRYLYSIGTSPGAADIRSWVSAGENTSVTAEGLDLQPGQTVFFSVVAENGNVGSGNSGTLSAAAHSDGITVAGNAVSIGEAKSLPDATPVLLAAKVVSASHPDLGFFYIQEPDCSSGIRVALAAESLEVGQQITVAGVLATHTINGIPSERQIQSPVVQQLAAPQIPPIPLHMSARSVGGSAIPPHIPGVEGGLGLINIGLLARVTGRVIEADGTSVTIRGASGHSVLVFIAPGHNLQTGNLVVAAGVVEGHIPEGASANVRAIRVRSLSDIAVLD